MLIPLSNAAMEGACKGIAGDSSRFHYKFYLMCLIQRPDTKNSITCMNGIHRVRIQDIILATTLA